jgi:hypothetical protein
VLQTHDIEELIGHFCQYSRPIADAFQEPRAEMRLLSSGLFFEAVNVFELHGSEHLEPALLMLLDEFNQLDQHSYNELYLWCIVQLSRMGPIHTAAFWPLVFDLDLRYRAASWRRSLGVSLVDQPYRLTELVFYFYVINTLQRSAGNGERPYPSLARCLLSMDPHLTGEQKGLVLDTLNQLAQEERRPEFGDAAGLLMRRVENGIDQRPGE